MTTTRAEPSLVAADPRRWLALGIIAVAQLMVVLDASIVNIALPSAQDALGISDANRPWRSAACSCSADASPTSWAASASS
jgi:hypothetical protein